MNLQKSNQSKQELINVKQSFLSVGITLTDEDWLLLQLYQQKICDHQNWVELASLNTLHKLIDSILFSGFLYQGNYMETLRRIITNYYYLRSLFTWSVRDEMIMEVIIDLWTTNFGIEITDIHEQACFILKKAGGVIYDESAI